MKEIFFFAFVAIYVFFDSFPSYALGLPNGWDNAIVLVEIQCTNLPSESCQKIPSIFKKKEECFNFCKKTGDTCPTSFLDFCKTPNDYYPIATGFLMVICNKVLLISNRHVLDKDQPLFIRARLKSGKMIRLRTGEVHGHPNPNVDIAACELIKPNSIPTENIDIKPISEDSFRKEGKTIIAPLSSIRAGDQTVFAGFPLIIGGVRYLVTDHETPLVRSGIVSIVLPGDTKIGNITSHNIFLMDSWAFQGNSGSPVIMIPSLTNYNNDNRDKKSAKIVGVVSAFLDLNAPIEKTVVIGGVKAKINSGLAIVQSLNDLEEIVMKFSGAKCIPQQQK